MKAGELEAEPNAPPKGGPNAKAGEVDPKPPTPTIKGVLLGAEKANPSPFFGASRDPV